MPPGNGLIKPVAQTAPKPKPVLQNPFHVPNTLGNDVVTGLPGVPSPGSNPGIAPPPAPVAPPPPDFNALTLADPQYIAAQADRAAQNKLALDALAKGFAQTSQSYQDNANHHGALFSGAAVHAQNYAGQQYADQQAQQAANNLQGQHGDYSAAWQRILQQLAGGS